MTHESVPTERSGVQPVSRSPAYRGLVAVLGIAVLAGAVVLATVAGADEVPQDTMSGWAGYVRVIARPPVPGQKPLGRLLRTMGFEVIDAESTVVYLTTYGGVEPVRYATVRDRLLQEDPRLDPYVRSLGNLFMTNRSSYRLYYVRTEWTAREVHRYLRRHAVDYDLHVVEYRPLDGIGAALPVLAVAIVVFLLMKDRRYVAFVTAAPAVAFVAVGGPSAMAVALVSYFAWTLVIDKLTYLARSRFFYRSVTPEESRAAVFRATYALMILAFSIGVGVVASSANTLGVILLFLANWATAIGLAIVSRARLAVHEHRLFLSVPIIERSPYESAAGAFSRTLSVSFVAILVPSLVALYFADRDRTIAPSPVLLSSPVQGALGYAPLRVAFAERSGRDPAYPAAADYIAHRAYQDSLPFGGVYGVPAESSRIEVLGAATVDGVLRPQMRTEIVFDRAWLERVIDEGNRDPLTRMLLSQPQPSGVVFPERVRLYWTRPVILRHVMLVLLSFMPFAAMSAVLAIRRIRGHRPSPLRRQRQEA